MTGNQFRLWLAAILLSCACLPASAQDILTIRSARNFDDTIGLLKASIGSHGYTVSHVQRCDQGLARAGHASDLYRVVFLGKFDEVRRLTQMRPDLIPFLPLKIVIFAEEDQTIVSAINPQALGKLFDDRELHVQFDRWERDLRSILRDTGRYDDDLMSPFEVSAANL